MRNQTAEINKVDMVSELFVEELYRFENPYWIDLTAAQQKFAKENFFAELTKESFEVDAALIQAVEEEFSGSPLASLLLEYIALNDTKHERTNDTKEINAALKIVKLSGQKFAVPGGYIVPTGYALYHPVYGFFGFKDNVSPYRPAGGKKALESIMAEGGFLNFTDSVWWKVRE
ncbi:hypothetical protein D3C87_1244550 [compost metagenome]